jgi:hypothetical protein
MEVLRKKENARTEDPPGAALMMDFLYHIDPDESRTK